MSDEPPTSGVVLLQTNYGELSIDIWSKEKPLTSRHFFQSCLDGSFDHAKINRIIKNCMVYCQSEKPIINTLPNLELHQKIKFSRRGMVALSDLN